MNCHVVVRGRGGDTRGGVPLGWKVLLRRHLPKELPRFASPEFDAVNERWYGWELPEGRRQARIPGRNRAEVPIQDEGIAMTPPLPFRIRIPHLERTQVVSVVHELRDRVAVVHHVEAIHTRSETQAQRRARGIPECQRRKVVITIRRAGYGWWREVTHGRCCIQGR